MGTEVGGWIGPDFAHLGHQAPPLGGGGVQLPRDLVPACLCLQTTLWQSFAAVVHLFVSKYPLRIVGRAFACFLRCLIEELLTATMGIWRHPLD